MNTYFRELSADQFTPITAYRAVAGKNSCLLESAPEEDRYSYIGVDPMASFTAKGRKIEVKIGESVEKFEANPFDALRAFQKKMKVEADHPVASFTGGAVGFITYDAVRNLEELPDRHPDLLQLPDFFFHVYRSSVAFDHQLGRAVLATIAENEEAGQLELAKLEEKLNRSTPMPLLREKKEISIEEDLTDEQFGEIVERAKEKIRQGEVFQMVPSRTFRAKIGAEPFQIYRALRQVSPAPYLFFFDFDGYAIAGASPEKIISVQNGIVESMPIAGTRPKGSSEEDFLKDPKEAAEHVMLVDLARNDLGAISVPGSVKVAEYKKIHKFSHLIHLVSKVRGKLDEKYDALDAFKASFPAGTLSGAPKVRAMELIDEMEISRRGLYGGAIAAFDSKGDLMSCIAIRTALIRDGEALIRTGAGIVLDSDPVMEAKETRLKAAAVLEALKLAEGAVR
ncbi:MAG: chorismate-binding protein [Verrucomicrobia bacterium]|nr:chorismate-binding protein [Verrucomicrobiota bacterium]